MQRGSEKRKSGPGVEMLGKARTGRNTFPSTNVDIATLTKGVRLRALNVDSVAAWIDQGICLLTAWWMSRFKTS